MSQYTIHDPGISVETLEEPQVIITSLQAVHQDTGQIWETLKSIENEKRDLFRMNKRANQRIVPQEAKRLRCMVLIHLVKINTLKVKWKLSCLIFIYKIKHIGRF